MQKREILRDRADAIFKVREQQRADAFVAVQHYRQAIRDNATRLRAERLARDAVRQRGDGRFGRQRERAGK